MEQAMFSRLPAFHTSAIPLGGMEGVRILKQWEYGDPAGVVDRLRQERMRQARDRLHKSRRIQALVKQAMKGVKR